MHAALMENVPHAKIYVQILKKEVKCGDVRQVTINIESKKFPVAQKKMTRHFAVVQPLTVVSETLKPCDYTDTSIACMNEQLLNSTCIYIIFVS